MCVGYRERLAGLGVTGEWEWYEMSGCSVDDGVLDEMVEFCAEFLFVDGHPLKE